MMWGSHGVTGLLIRLIIIVTLVTSDADANHLRKRATTDRRKLCIGTTGRMSVPNNRDHHYRNLRDRYSNCTYVDGNLELTWLQDPDQDLSFLKDIREVTGYVLISHVDVKKIVLPSLQIIRGRTLFKLNVHNDEFALIVTLSKMYNLEMPALRDILSGSVGILNNYNLCHVKTIQWNEIITSPTAKYRYEYRFREAERECTPCHESCEAGCWGEGPHNCQKFSKISCSPQCHQGRCFGPKPRECCHLFCAGGCTGPKQSDCLACRNFYDDGVCKQECPPMQRYNPVKYSWEKNPEGKYAYGATCVKDCPKHLLKDNGACVRVCPDKKKNVDGECVPCDGVCPKTCHFSDTVHAGNIDSLQNCTVIEGSLTILDSSFDGFQEIYDNFTFGPRHPGMAPERLEVLSTLKEITGFLNIQSHHDSFRNLGAFRNLEVIGGRTLTEYFASLYIVKTSLTSLGLRSLRKISSGSVAILENEELCYAGDINWTQMVRSQVHNTLLQNNRDPGKCIAGGAVCDKQCSSEGCWGPGNKMCLSCRTYNVDEECVPSCDPNLGLYEAGEAHCMKCHPECKMTCFGPGADACHACANARDGPFCVAECPDGKFLNNSTGECMQCHDNCVNGCTGPDNSLGPNGCKSCDKAIINSDLEVIKCLKHNETCPDGYFYEWVVPQSESKLKALAGKPICRPCHYMCEKCTGYGSHKDVCQACKDYEEDEQCVKECSPDFYANETTRQCLPCASECRSCTGPLISDCLSCQNFKVYADLSSDPYLDTPKFNCTDTCPEAYPNVVHSQEGAYCSDDPMAVAKKGVEGPITAIVVAIVCCVLITGVFGVVCFCQWRRRAIAKENTAKMTMVMTGYEDNEPLRLTNIKPNLAKLKIVKEAELRKGGILGFGAFGTVYKGVWVPEGENVKIPVAVKVLNEGTGTTANNEILDEAYIMASVEHPNLLQLLAVCMTSQMMLVTQLMPLGCLLDYVRNNKDKIGSKPLLNWCTQIARGMAYLEDKRLVHRDLAARNVLVQTPSCVKITDFGLAKLLDINEDEYKAHGGKMPIKWLALECIQHRIFTHKSDVWAFGVTVWELLTYGARPYENTPAREVPDLLEKGERLNQPGICSIDLYMILVKCWMVDAESRPGFKELSEQFAKMARDPGRYLCIPGDKLMRLPSYTTQDEKELIKNLAQNICNGSEAVVVADEYLNPGRMPSQHTLNTPVDTPLAPSTPTQKFTFPPPGGSQQAPPSYHTAVNGGGSTVGRGGVGYPPSNRHSTRYNSSHAINEGFSTMGPMGSRSLQRHSNFFSTSCDPLKLLEDEMDGGGTMSMPTTTTTMTAGGGLNTMSSVSKGPRPPVTVAGLRLDLPLDDEDYLMPSPQSPMQFNNNPAPGGGHGNPYMDLISETTPAQPGSGGGFGGGGGSGSGKASHGGTMFVYPPAVPTDTYYPGGFINDNPYEGVGHHGFGGAFVSMDNPEYILNEHQQRLQQQRSTSSQADYHTLGIPLVNPSGKDPSSPAAHTGGNGGGGPPSILSVHSGSGGPTGSQRSGHPASLSSNGSTSTNPGPTATISGASTGLNGCIVGRGSTGSDRNGSGDEHEYYNDFDRLKRQAYPPCMPGGGSSQGGPKLSVSSNNSSTGGVGVMSVNQVVNSLQPVSQHETTV